MSNYMYRPRTSYLGIDPSLTIVGMTPKEITQNFSTNLDSATPPDPSDPTYAKQRQTAVLAIVVLVDNMKRFLDAVISAGPGGLNYDIINTFAIKVQDYNNILTFLLTKWQDDDGFFNAPENASRWTQIISYRDKNAQSIETLNNWISVYAPPITGGTPPPPSGGGGADTTGGDTTTSEKKVPWLMIAIAAVGAYFVLKH